MGATVPEALLGHADKVIERDNAICCAARVCTWPISEVAARLIEVRSVGRSGLDLLTLSSSHFDPKPSWGASPHLEVLWRRLQTMNAGGQPTFID